MRGGKVVREGLGEWGANRVSHTLIILPPPPPQKIPEYSLVGMKGGEVLGNKVGEEIEVLGKRCREGGVGEGGAYWGSKKWLPR